MAPARERGRRSFTRESIRERDPIEDGLDSLRNILEGTGGKEKPSILA